MTVKTRLEKLEKSHMGDLMFAVTVPYNADSTPYIESYCEEHNISEHDKERALWMIYTKDYGEPE